MSLVRRRSRLVRRRCSLEADRLSVQLLTLENRLANAVAVRPRFGVDGEDAKGTRGASWGVVSGSLMSCRFRGVSSVVIFRRWVAPSALEKVINRASSPDADKLNNGMVTMGGSRRVTGRTDGFGTF